MGSKERDFGKSKYLDKHSFFSRDVSVERKHGDPEMNSDAWGPRVTSRRLAHTLSIGNTYVVESIEEQHVKTPDVKPGNLSLSPRTYMLKGEN